MRSYAFLWMLSACLLTGSSLAQTAPSSSGTVLSAGPTDPLQVGKQALRQGDWQNAQEFFRQYLEQNPKDAVAVALLGDALSGLKQYDEAAKQYRQAIESSPELWLAHKNLVVAYAALGKWQEFDAERKLLRDARDRNAASLDKNADLVEVLQVKDSTYYVREFYQLSGKYHTRYLFIHFGADKKADSWIACESDDVDQTFFAQKHPKEAAAGKRSFSLDSYAPNSHGTIKFYSDGEPDYEKVRSDVVAFLEKKIAPQSTTTLSGSQKKQ